MNFHLKDTKKFKKSVENSRIFWGIKRNYKMSKIIPSVFFQNFAIFNLNIVKLKAVFLYIKFGVSLGNQKYRHTGRIANYEMVRIFFTNWRNWRFDTTRSWKYPGLQILKFRKYPFSKFLIICKFSSIVDQCSAFNILNAVYSDWNISAENVWIF